jgi:hypothetical protein
MQLRLLLRNTLIPAALFLGFLGCLAANQSIQAQTQTTTSEPIVVTGEEVPSAYGATPDFSRSRFSNLTNAYVLAPGAAFFGLIYQGDALRFNRPDHLFTQELEFGLPHRFGIAFENTFEGYRGNSQDRTFSIEGRYAFADWGKIPLNPTIFVEYKFGIGTIFHDEGPPAPLEKGEAQEFLDEHIPLPDAFEVRLLLAQDFGKVEWALNGFFEQEIGGDRGREMGFAQSAMIPITRDERLKIGVEMQLTVFNDRGIRDNDEPDSYRFIVGPTIAWKPSKNTRFDLSPLFGVTDDSPRASVFLVFSYLMGPGGEPTQAEAPASTRNR